MPLEVRQIELKMSVGDEASPAAAGPQAASGGARLSRRERRAIVRETAAAVLDALRLERER